MQTMGPRSPFLRTWTNPKREERALSAANTEIYIAPVDTKDLRPIGKKMAARQYQRWDRERPVREIAQKMRDEFARTFRDSPRPRYRLVDRPSPQSVTLQLSLVELDPTSTTGNAARKGASLAVGPIAGLAGIFTAGAIAVEGRLIDSSKGWSIFEFADREKDKMTFWNLRDFKAYGHGEVAIKEWAGQFEETTRNPNWKDMGDARIWTLWPW
ncbi:MAG: hypothetical protein ACI8XO_002745 [Verrucomicrobiales bacterium]|jgi:hypothetical protein